MCKGASRMGPDLQLTEALKLYQAALIDPASITGSLEDVRKLQNHLRKYKITIFARRDGKEALFEGPDIETENYVDLYHHHYGRHFNVISLMTGFTDSAYFYEK